MDLPVQSFQKDTWISGIWYNIKLRYLFRSKKTLRERGCRQLRRIRTRDRHDIFRQIATDFNRTSTSVIMSTVQETIIDVDFRYRRPLSCTIVDYTTQSVTSRLGPISLLDCWWLKMYYLVWWESFPVVSGGWTRTVWRKPHESVDPIYQQEIIQRESLIDGMGCVHLMWCGILDISRDDSDTWQVHKTLVQWPTHINACHLCILADLDKYSKRIWHPTRLEL